MQVALKSVLILIAILVLCYSLPAAEKRVGSPCETHSRARGICRKNSNCPWLVENLKKKQMSTNDIVICTFDGLDDVVCCKEEPDFSQSNKNISGETDTSSTRIIDRADTACQRWLNESELHFKIAGNSSEADLGEFPHMAAIFVDSNEIGQTSKFTCGGSIISNRFILTAAHCMREKPKFVRIGQLNKSHNFQTIEDPDFGVEQVISHPEYNGAQELNDIALIKLDRDIDFTTYVFPACLNTDRKDVESNQMIATGWGQTNETSGTSDLLLKVNVTGLNLEPCQQRLQQRYNVVHDRRLKLGISDKQMCAHDPNAINDVCQGDSGGPLQIAYEKGLNLIIGITSYGFSCATKHPTVYTRVAAYTDWIAGVVTDW